MSLSEAKMKLSALAEAVNATDEEVVITKNGRPVAVLVSPDEFESWRETTRVQSDSDLMQEIKKGLASLKKGKASLYTLEDLIPEQDGE
jgi:prevent-host-death family protein